MSIEDAVAVTAGFALSRPELITEVVRRGTDGHACGNARDWARPMTTPARRGVDETKCVDTCGTKIAAAGVSGGKILDARRREAPRPATPDAVVEAGLEMIADRPERIERLGVACAGGSSVAG